MPFQIEDSQLALDATEYPAIFKAEHSASIRNRFERMLTAIEVFADWLAVVIAVCCGYEVYHYLHMGRGVTYRIAPLLYVSCALGGLFIILLDREGAYRPANSLLRIKETERSLRVTVQAFLLVVPITFFSKFMVARSVIVLALICVPMLQVLEKQLLLIGVRALRERGVGVKRVVIYGAGSSGKRVFSSLIRSPKLGLKPVVVIDDDLELEGEEIFESDYRRSRSIKIISERITKELLEKFRCQLLVVAIPSLDRERFVGAVTAAHGAKAGFAYVPGPAITGTSWMEHADIDGTLLSVLGRPPEKLEYEMAKRLFDLCAALVLMVIFSPIWLVIALLVRLDSSGPVFFEQQRVGKEGKFFNLYKFRSMYVDAPRYGFSPTASGDPRITRIGRFLRRTSLDELPQLINVLKGEMSLVGPRPEMPFIVTEYTAVDRQRLQVIPGLTGLWQLSADRAFKIHENIHYDLYYIANRNFFMDFAILIHTALFAMRGV